MCSQALQDAADKVAENAEPMTHKATDALHEQTEKVSATYMHSSILSLSSQLCSCAQMYWTASLLSNVFTLKQTEEAKDANEI